MYTHKPTIVFTIEVVRMLQQPTFFTLTFLKIKNAIGVRAYLMYVGKY